MYSAELATNICLDTAIAFPWLAYLADRGKNVGQPLLTSGVHEPPPLHTHTHTYSGQIQGGRELGMEKIKYNFIVKNV